MAKADVTVTLAVYTSVDMPSIKRALVKAEVAVVENWATATVKEIREHWQGWKNPTGESRGRWKRERLQTGQDGRVAFAITNAARSKRGKAYSAFVHRAGQMKPYSPEWKVVLDEIIEPAVPLLQTQLAAAIQRSIAAGVSGPAKRMRLNRPSVAETLTLER